MCPPLPDQFTCIAHQLAPSRRFPKTSSNLKSRQTLREELRKVQSSAALLERQRNPGVGYWNNRAGDAGGEPGSPMTGSNVGSASPRPASPALSASSVSTNATAGNKPEEEVNLEYLRNVILQFLEHKEMRVSGCPLDVWNMRLTGGLFE